MRKWFKQNKCIYSIMLFTLSLFQGIEQAAANTNISGTVNSESFSFVTWILVGLVLAAFGFTTKSKT